MNTFHIVDYIVLAAVLLGSLGTGVFFACSGGKQKTTSEYFRGNKQLSVLPVSMSIMVSYISGIMIIGLPAEVYLYGGMNLLAGFGVAFGALTAAMVYVPMFYPLNLTSINTYLEARLNSQIPKLMCTAANIFFTICYTGLVIYAPATTISIATGIPMWMVILVSCIIVIIYTSIGGLKAVIWTDVFQCVMMLSGVLAICITGVYLSGGISNTIKYNREGGRLNLWNFDFHPHTRLTFWTMVPSNILSYGMLYGATQTTLQRYCGLPSLFQARLCMMITALCVITIQITAVFAGLSMYGYFYSKGCDPLSSGEISTPNQLVPYFVMETMNYPGIPGLFVSAMCAGGLSSASSVLNSASANTWVDFLQPLMKTVSERRATLISKLIVVFYGILAIGMAFGVSMIGGTITQVSISFNGAILIVITGMISFVALVPFANTIGTTVGVLVSFIFSMWIAMGSYMVKTYETDMLPFVSHGCTANNSILTNITEYTAVRESSTFGYSTAESSVQEGSWLEALYGVTFYWYKLYGLIIILVVGCFVSWLTGGTKQEPVDASLVFSFVRLSRYVRQKDTKKKLEVETNGDMKENGEVETLQKTSVL